MGLQQSQRNDVKHHTPARRSRFWSNTTAPRDDVNQHAPRLPLSLQEQHNRKAERRETTRVAPRFACFKSNSNG